MEQVAMLLQQVMVVVRSIETERGIVGAGETIAGSPQDGWADAGEANESDGSECERYVSGWWQQCGQGARGARS